MIYRTLLEVKESRRQGNSLAFLIDNLLQSEKLLQEHRSPFLVLAYAGISLANLEGEYCDFSSSSWEKLSVKKQIAYAKEYQQWYAQQIKEPLEKSFEQGTSLKMMLIPPGKFWRGTRFSKSKHRYEEIAHKVLLDQAFWCGKYPVTQQQWKSIFKERRRFLKKNLEKPITKIDWKESQKFCIQTQSFLLSEAQWEYACRAGTTTAFYFGDNPKKINSSAWNFFNADFEAHRVGQKRPNPWGLYDFYGNVWEWCQDRYGNYPTEECKNPKGSKTGNQRICRGGSFSMESRHCTSFFRHRLEANTQSPEVGFRVAKKREGS
jgi:formylglycine-generating enzyme required for sulfatase activity